VIAPVYVVTSNRRSKTVVGMHCKYVEEIVWDIIQMSVDIECDVNHCSWSCVVAHCLFSRLAAVDGSSIMTLYDITAMSAQGASAESKLERKDVWSVKWAEV